MITPFLPAPVFAMQSILVDRYAVLAIVPQFIYYFILPKK